MSRIKKWNKNYQAYCPKRLRKMKPMIKAQLAVQFEALEKLENTVKKIMGESGLPTWHNIPYLNFARQIYRIIRKHSGKTRTSEIKIIMQVWQDRQLKKRLLIKIRNAILALFSNT